jgi:hypothetical protein
VLDRHLAAGRNWVDACTIATLIDGMPWLRQDFGSKQTPERHGCPLLPMIGTHAFDFDTNEPICDCALHASHTTLLVEKAKASCADS